ncbi:MAG: SDR family NAD(P)-dependent oxidoreductase [Arenicella sp.]|nr:SDR family NAD(P)-dependent oxidoreductase [Arenicella sp.]
MSKPTALVTGASSGIGLATARSLFSSGYSVHGIARDFSNTDFDPLIKTELDLSQIDVLANSLKQFKSAPDVLVLNAGYGQFGGIEQFSHDQIRRLVDTNLVSNLFLIKHFLPAMKQQGGGDIVLIGSESAVQGAKAGAVYCATKFAIRGLAQSLRADGSTAGIRVILVNPGPVNTDFFDQLNFEPQPGDEFEIPAQSVADVIMSALEQPRSVVVDEINMQPIKRSFRKK